MGRAVVIVQARHASTRLPGKVLLDLNGQTVLSRVLRRCQAIEAADAVCCAIPESADCDGIVAEAEKMGVTVYRGSEDDVLARYLGAAEQMKADVILRVTSDCPLLDPTVCGDVLALRASQGADYACNNMPPSWPHGLDCEAFPFSWLERAANEATHPFEREHVTPFIRNHPKAKTANLPSPDPALARYRWTLDTAADFTFFEALWPHLPEGSEAWGYSHALAIVQAHPEIASINAGETASDTRGKTRSEWGAR